MSWDALERQHCTHYLVVYLRELYTQFHYDSKETFSFILLLAVG